MRVEQTESRAGADGGLVMRKGLLLAMEEKGKKTETFTENNENEEKGEKGKR